MLTFQHLTYRINPRDHNPPHVHVDGGGAAVRINLMTLEVMDKETDFSKKMVKRIILKVAENRELFLEEWERIHGKKD